MRVEIVGVFRGAADQRFTRRDAGGARLAVGRGSHLGVLERVEPGALRGDASGEARRVLGAGRVTGGRAELRFEAIELGAGPRRIGRVLEGVDALRQQRAAAGAGLGLGARIGGPLLADAHEGAGPPGDDGVARAFGDDVHRRAIAEAIDGGDAGVVELGRDRDGLELGRIGEALEGPGPDRVVAGVPGDGAERAPFAQALEGGEGDLGVGRRLGHLHQRAFLTQRPRGERGARHVGAVEGERQQPGEGVGAHLRVDVAAGDGAERVGVGEPGNRRASHARRFVGAGEDRDHAKLGLGQRVQ